MTNPLTAMKRHPILTTAAVISILAVATLLALTGFGLIPLGFGLAAFLGLSPIAAQALHAGIAAAAVICVSAISAGFAKLAKLFFKKQANTAEQSEDVDLELSSDETPESTHEAEITHSDNADLELSSDATPESDHEAEVADSDDAVTEEQNEVPVQPAENQDNTQPQSHLNMGEHSDANSTQQVHSTPSSTDHIPTAIAWPAPVQDVDPSDVTPYPAPESGDAQKNENSRSDEQPVVPSKSSLADKAIEKIHSLGNSLSALVKRAPENTTTSAAVTEEQPAPVYTAELPADNDSAPNGTMVVHNGVIQPDIMRTSEPTPDTTYFTSSFSHILSPMLREASMSSAKILRDIMKLDPKGEIVQPLLAKGTSLGRIYKVLKISNDNADMTERLKAGAQRPALDMPQPIDANHDAVNITTLKEDFTQAKNDFAQAVDGFADKAEAKAKKVGASMKTGAQEFGSSVRSKMDRLFHPNKYLPGASTSSLSSSEDSNERAASTPASERGLFASSGKQDSVSDLRKGAAELSNSVLSRLSINPWNKD